MERFAEKFGGVDRRQADVAVFRISPVELRFIESADEDDDAERRLGADYRISIVYSLFHRLPEQQVAEAAATLGMTQVEPGEVVIRQGAADKLFIIVEGEVEVVREDDGAARTVATLGVGPVLRRDGDSGRQAPVRDGAGGRAHDLAVDGARRVPVARRSVALDGADFDRIVQERLESLETS